jgi:hypothetical protein
MQYIFGLLNDISFLISMALISLSLPGLAQTIQSTLLNFIYVDIMQTDAWLLPMMFNSTELGEGQAINPFFDDNGYSSCIFIANLGSTFIYILIYFAIFLLLSILRIIRTITCDSLNFLRLYSNWFESKILWNSVFRFIIQQYPPILISGLINIYNFDTSTQWKMISTYIAMVVLGVCKIAIISMSIIIYKHRFNLESKYFQDNYGTLVERLDLCKHS